MPVLMNVTDDDTFDLPFTVRNVLSELRRAGNSLLAQFRYFGCEPKIVICPEQHERAFRFEMDWIAGIGEGAAPEYALVRLTFDEILNLQGVVALEWGYIAAEMVWRNVSRFERRR